MTPEEFNEKLSLMRKKQQQIADLELDIRVLCEEVKENHPDSVKTGDIVQCNGYSFKDKDMTVGHVHVSARKEGGYGKDKPQYEFHLSTRGKIHNKDGTPGMRTGEYMIILK